MVQSGVDKRMVANNGLGEVALSEIADQPCPVPTRKIPAGVLCVPALPLNWTPGLVSRIFRWVRIWKMFPWRKDEASCKRTLFCRRWHLRYDSMRLARKWTGALIALASHVCIVTGQLFCRTPRTTCGSPRLLGISRSVAYDVGCTESPKLPQSFYLVVSSRELSLTESESLEGKEVKHASLSCAAAYKYTYRTVPACHEERRK